jgi:methylmalonyl-CoA mutase C-terminal domain/subunit
MSRTCVLIGVMGIDQHENGAVAVSKVLREAQMQVVYGGLFNTPESIVEKALAANADVIGISVVGGSVLTPKDRRRLAALGVAACFGADATPDDIVNAIRDLTAAGVR